jgi:hypothetical protein
VGRTRFGNVCRAAHAALNEFSVAVRTKQRAPHAQSKSRVKTSGRRVSYCRCRGCLRPGCRHDRRDYLRRRSRRSADSLRSSCRPDDEHPADRRVDDLSADECPADVADERPAGGTDDRPAVSPVCASRASRQDRPSRGRGASDSRTNTSPARAIRRRTSRSACRGKRTEHRRRQRLGRLPCAGRRARSRPLARGRQRWFRPVRARGRQ